MKYLVLRRFKSLGVIFQRGDEVDESQLLHPKLLLEECKIVSVVASTEPVVEIVPVEETEPVAVSSSIVPELAAEIPVQEPIKEVKIQKITLSK